jgi:acetyl esterase/lipase
MLYPKVMSLQWLSYFFPLTIIISVPAFAQEFIPLWPKGFIPNSTTVTIEDSIAHERIYKVGVPGMWVFTPPAQENKGTAVIVCPGGGYDHLAIHAAGFQIAKWFNTFGVNAFVLKYRLPNAPDLQNRHIVPLQDAQRAMRYIRAHAVHWRILPDKIGIFGTSAGGQLASMLGTQLDDVSSIGDSLDKASFRPNFLILISPVIDLGRYTHSGTRDNLLGPHPSKTLIEKYSSQLQVTSATPPSFIVHALNDPAVPVRNSVLFYQALLDSNVSVSFHEFPLGAHTIGLRDNPGSTELWTKLCEMWLNEMGFISGKR